jgi:hypothetical protein
MTGPTVRGAGACQPSASRARCCGCCGGKDLELLSREPSVPAAALSAWRDAFLAADEASLKTRPADGRDAEIGRL